jgi:colanic acid/amylovoran biosynthesis glycosyltransferase
MTRWSVPANRPPALLHVCGRYLPLSETFTYDLLRGMPGFTHHVIASSIENRPLFPWPSVHAPSPASGAWALARRWGVDAVVCHFGPQATQGLPIGLMLDVPVITLFHGYDVSRLLQDRAWVERYRACFAAGMRALCISEAGRRRLLDIGAPADQVGVVHLGVDTRSFAYRPPSARWTSDRPLRLLMVSRLVPKKGVHVALAAADRLATAGVPFEFRIIGDGPEHAALAARREALGLRNVTLCGAATHQQTRAAFAWADIYLQPSVTAPDGDQEGIPVALMEAMASGLPVIATRHSGIPELVVDGRSGRLTDEHDDDALAQAVADLWSRPAWAEQIALEGRRRVEEAFDQRRQAQRVEQWITAVIGTTGSQPRRFAPSSAGARRALVLQSLDTALLARKLTLLAHRHPGTTFDILATEVDACALDDLPYVGRVHQSTSATLSLRAIDRRQWRDLASVGYDLVVVPYGDETGLGAARARRLASTLSARQVVGLTLRDREHRLPGRASRVHAPAPAVPLPVLSS